MTRLELIVRGQLLSVFAVLCLSLFLVCAASPQTNCTPGTWSQSNLPPESCFPYPNSIFQKPLPNAGTGGPMNHLAANSDTTMQTILQDSGGLPYGFTIASTPAASYSLGGGDDGGADPIYLGRASDPIYVTTCVNGSNTYLHIPNQAHMSSLDDYVRTGDHFFTVWDQTSNQIFGGYAGSALTTVAGGTLPNCTATDTAHACSFSFVTFCSLNNYSTDLAVGTGGGADTLGTAALAMTLKGQEWMDDAIHHALYFNTHCEATGEVFPATGGQAQLCSAIGISDTNRPFHGALYFVDYTDAQLNAMSIPAWRRNLLRALAHYGAYQGDTGLTTSISRFEGGEPYQLAGVTFPLFGSTWNNGWLASQGVPCIGAGDPGGSVCRYEMSIFDQIPNVTGPNCPTSTCGILQHIHIADQCVALGLAGKAGGCVTQTPPAAPTGLTAKAQ